MRVLIGEVYSDRMAYHLPPNYMQVQMLNDLLGIFTCFGY